MNNTGQVPGVGQSNYAGQVPGAAVGGGCLRWCRGADDGDGGGERIGTYLVHNLSLLYISALVFV